MKTGLVCLARGLEYAVQQWDTVENRPLHLEGVCTATSPGRQTAEQTLFGICKVLAEESANSDVVNEAALEVPAKMCYVQNLFAGHANKHN